MKANEAAAYRARAGRNFVRHVHWVAGLHAVWASDQYDKWRNFGLFLHMGMECCSGAILWMRVWWTNRNPRWVAASYLSAVEEFQGPSCAVFLDAFTLS